LTTNSFDPIAYIESGFLDTRTVEATEADLTIPDFSGFPENKTPPEDLAGVERGRFRKTVMSAPRPRRTKKNVATPAIDSDLNDTWLSLPKNVAFLCSFFDDQVTKNYYRGEFKENRQELIRRLLDPELSLEETARLLGVCPATVRRYTNREWLAHHRTVGGQRRFRLSNIVKFVGEHGRLPEE
jgi:hypothetical protein